MIVQRAILVIVVSNVGRAGRNIEDLSYEERDEVMATAIQEWHKLCTEIRPPLPEIRIAELVCEQVAQRSQSFARAFREEDARRYGH
jgi:hypothetical protein